MKADPDRLTAVYATPEPNAAVSLFRGLLKVGGGDFHLSGQGGVALEWLPSPRVVFGAEGRVHLKQALSQLGELAIVAPSIGLEARALHTWSTSRLLQPEGSERVPYEIRGTLNGPMRCVRSRRRIKRIVFHVPNFRNFVGTPVSPRGEGGRSRSRLTLRTEDWRLTLDAVPNVSQLTGSLDDTGGFALTHVGQVEAIPPGRLSWKRAGGLLDLLTWSLSFARGAWCGPVLIVGLDEEGNGVREDWRLRRIGNWDTRPNWFEERRPEAFVEFFTGLAQLWSDPEWQSALRVAIDLYMESHLHPSSEGAMLLAQAALELLGWVTLVEKERAYSRREFDSLPAAERISRLLVWAGLTLKLPPSVPNLRRFAWRYGWKSGPIALAGLRNGIAHPRYRHRAYSSTGLQRYEGRQLSLWYIEMILLRLANVSGHYANRLKRTRWKGEVDRVPWARDRRG